jgi:geranylgeranyl pyrophosphate synthase
MKRCATALDGGKRVRPLLVFAAGALLMHRNPCWNALPVL